MGYTTDLNCTFDLFLLAERDTTLLKTGAGWWAGPCPFCGGTDRFTLKNTDAGWRWFCRGCGDDKYHTPVDYVMRREQCDFQAALTWMVGNTTPTGNRWDVPSKRIESESARPSESWQARGLVFVETCASALWSEPGARALHYLRARGLEDAAIHQYHLGYNQIDHFEPLEIWGLSEPDDSKRHAVWLPRGIVLPCFADGMLWYLKFRRPITHVQEQAGEQKYLKVKGSKPGIFGAENLRGAWLAILTEGEFDCMLLDQGAGDLAGVATLGSATDRINRLDMGIWGRHILPVAHFLAAYDADKEGEKGLRALEAFSERVTRVSLPAMPGVKDITDFWKANGDLGEWVVRTVDLLGLLPNEAGIGISCATKNDYPRQE
jgi:DNA primase